MSSSNLRRDMSYRKPVPVYEPSPPSSPAPVQQGHSLSLPQTWSQMQEKQSNLPEDYVELAVPSMIFLQPPSPVVTADGRAGSPPMASSSRAISHDSRWEGSEEPSEPASSYLDRRRRGLHRNYRPPTPPLPARHKRRRLTSAFPSEDHISLSNSGHAAPSADTSLVHAASLRPTPSFTTERTAVSLATAPHTNPNDVSSGWSGGLTTFVSESDPRLSSSPLPLNRLAPQKAFSEVEFDKTGYEEPPTSCFASTYGMLKSFGTGLKKCCVVFCL